MEHNRYRNAVYDCKLASGCEVVEKEYFANQQV